LSGDKTNADTSALEIVDGRLQTSLDLRCYRLSAVQKAGYRLAERCTVILGEPRGEKLPVQLLFKANTSDAEARESMRLFFQELLDQELREKIGEETAPLRALLMAQAFSNTDLINRE
jgi:His-Xaa-Ser system protein HxsD